MSADGTEARGGATEPAGTADNATLAHRLQVLFETVPRRQAEGGTLYKVPEVAAAIGISKPHMYNILSGKSTPTWPVVQRIADLFGVGLTYFENSDAGAKAAHQMELLGALGLSEVNAVEFRGRSLSPKAGELLANFARQLAEFEHGESGRSDSDYDVES